VSSTGPNVKKLQPRKVEKATNLKRDHNGAERTELWPLGKKEERMNWDAATGGEYQKKDSKGWRRRRVGRSEREISLGARGTQGGDPEQPKFTSGTYLGNSKQIGRKGRG